MMPVHLDNSEDSHRLPQFQVPIVLPACLAWLYPIHDPLHKMQNLLDPNNMTLMHLKNSEDSHLLPQFQVTNGLAGCLPAYDLHP